jgi:hypothetical protein
VEPEPIIDARNERNTQPDELFADTLYVNWKNAYEAEMWGTKLVSPVVGNKPEGADGDENVGSQTNFAAADFQIAVLRYEKAVCPAGRGTIIEYR